MAKTSKPQRSAPAVEGAILKVVPESESEAIPTVRLPRDKARWLQRQAERIGVPVVALTEMAVVLLCGGMSRAVTPETIEAAADKPVPEDRPPPEGKAALVSVEVSEAGLMRLESLARLLGFSPGALLNVPLCYHRRYFELLPRVQAVRWTTIRAAVQGVQAAAREAA